MWGEGHSTVVDAAVVSAEVGVLQRVFKCGVNPSITIGSPVSLFLGPESGTNLWNL